MKLSVESGIFKTLTHRERLKMIKDAGFDAVDFSLFSLSGENAELIGENYAECAEELRRYMEDIGIEACQAHAPFEMTAADPISPECPKYVRLTRAIEAAGILGAPYIVVHCIKASGEEFLRINREFYLSLLPYAERVGIKIAVENLFGPADENGVRPDYFGDPAEHLAFVRSLGSPYFTVCVDLGHSALVGRRPEDVIRAMDPELFMLMHMHDNDCKDDLHRIPYSALFDWSAICAALKEIGYRGGISLELIGHFRALPKELHADALKYAERVGRRIIAMCSGE